MKQLLINGPVVDDSDVWYYAWFGEPYVSPSNVRQFLAEANGEDIQVSINSGGGSVFAGSEIYTMLKSYSGKVSVLVSGLAASIASVIMLSGDTIKAAPLAQIMIHNAQMGQWGDYRDLEHASVVVGGVSQSLVSLYADKTGLSEEEIKSLVDAESWFTAERAKELGFIDEVLFQEKVELIASAGHYVSKEKIGQFKAMLNASQAKRNDEDNPVLQRMEDFESRLKAFENQREQDVKLVAELEKRLSDKSEKPKVNSPFAKFI